MGTHVRSSMYIIAHNEFLEFRFFEETETQSKQLLIIRNVLGLIVMISLDIS